MHSQITAFFEFKIWWRNQRFSKILSILIIFEANSNLDFIADTKVSLLQLTWHKDKAGSKTKRQTDRKADRQKDSKTSERQKDRLYY